MNINTPDPPGGLPPGVTNEEEADIRHLSAVQLAKLGVAQVAYVKQIILNGAPAFAIHAADGTPMAVAGDREGAMAAIRQHEMVPLSVH
jgi:hypothetical protein